MVVQTALPKQSTVPKASPRLLALDGLRGLTVLLMLLVNNVALDAATPDTLTHAPFGGVNLADLVFPWFLFCMGAAIPYAHASFLKSGQPVWAYVQKALVRSIVLFAIGLFLTSALAHAPVFALGVLQLIALAYLVAALIYVALPRTVPLLVVAGVLLVGYWAALRFVPVPGAGPGIFEEDRNLLLYLNQTYLEPIGLRGLLSVIPTTALALLGAVVSRILRSGGRGDPKTTDPAARPVPISLELLALGTVMALVGWLWSFTLPFSKTFWTSPYILFSAGLGTLVIALFYGLFDLRGWRSLAFPLTVPGSNALLAYVAPILFKIWVLQGWSVGGQSLQKLWLNAMVGLSGPVIGGWLYTLSYIAAWWLALLWLYRRSLFLRV
jgi:predicted acyltransferase